MKIYRLEKKQNVPISLSEAWDFFSSPKNLAEITPDKMGFVIQSGLSDKMYAGQLITYTVRPLLGIPMTWVTEITHVQDHQYFVDEQRFGPYDMWHHQHFFKEIDGGTECIDIVDYKLPMGILGQMMHGILVEKELEGIFNYREQKLIELFGEFNPVINMNQSRRSA